MSSDIHARRIRESLLRLDQTPTRVTQESRTDEVDLSESLRRLARARVALMLRQLRAAYGLTYSQVQADTGLAQQVLFDVEFKDRRLTLAELRLLAECYKISISDILGVDVD